MELKNNTSIKKIIINISIVAILIAIFYIIIISKNGINYILSDDYELKSIASGEYIGKPSLHMIHIGFPYSICLTLLYKFIPFIDWYGFMFISLMIFFLGYTIYQIIKDEKDIFKKIIITTTILIILSLTYTFFLIGITFTTVSSFISICCLILYLLPENKSKNIIMQIGIILAIGIRMKACLMILIFFVPALLYKNYNKKEEIKKDIILGTKIGIVLIVCFMIEKSFYANEEWKEYLKYDKLRSLYYDYYREYLLDMPAEEVREIYKNAGFDIAEANFLHTYSGIGFYEDIPLKMEKLIEECKKSIKLNYNMGTKLKQILIMPQNLYYIATLLIIMILIIKVPNKKEKCLTIIPFILLQLFILVYLTSKGRIPSRVIIPLLTCYIATNVYIIMQEKETKVIKDNIFKYNKFIIAMFMVILVLVSISTIKLNSKEKEYINKENIIQEYIENHPDNFYIYDNSGFFKFHLFCKSKEKNTVLRNTWLVYSPLYRKKLENQGCNSLKELVIKDNVYMILDDKSAKKYKYIDENLEIQEVDRIDKKYIYKIYKKID